ncbi:hypothetical protein FSP39_004883 [Pinctada imbricata]|uniref:C2H2-type domain-containing protein n=1 Tax=Pinctada imbricata TaxID=66713 RepID=A0AA88YSW9_PINIB|nr:hypothetical protein FSP39_004883 [Pinctada imbricata]
MLEKHSDEYPFKCEDCGKMFHHLAGFNCHRTQHKRGPYVPKAAQEESAVIHGGRSNPDDPNCVCDICGKVLATPKSKYAHMKMAHSDEKPYCCEICGFRTKQLGNLKYHHTIHHSDEKPFECKECGKTFRVHQLLKKHMASHLLKKGLVTEAAKLTKMYRCPDCGKTFVGKSNFESHRLMHFDKELKCAICDSRMRRRGTLRRHYSRIHKFSTAEIDELTKNIPMDKDLIPVKQNNRRVSLQYIFIILSIIYSSDKVKECMYCLSIRLSAWLKELILLKQNNRQVKVEVIEEAGEDISDAESEMEIVTDETLLLEQDTAPSTSQPVEKTRQRDFVQEAQAQVSLLTSPETAPSTLSFDPNQVQFEEVSVSEEFVALSETVTTETTSTTTQEAEPESQQIILDGPLADMLHEKVIRAVVNTDGSISIHIQE